VAPSTWAHGARGVPDPLRGTRGPIPRRLYCARVCSDRFSSMTSWYDSSSGLSGTSAGSRGGVPRGLAILQDTSVQSACQCGAVRRHPGWQILHSHGDMNCTCGMCGACGAYRSERHRKLKSIAAPSPRAKPFPSSVELVFHTRKVFRHAGGPGPVTAARRTFLRRGD
jgi:hypothetical protein